MFLRIDNNPAQVFNTADEARESCAILNDDADDCPFVVYIDPKGSGRAIIKCHDSIDWEVIGEW